jgi:Cu(I)-responsive transcriptional regulator
MTPYLTIGKLARETGTKVETIRFYEKTGLLPAPRRTAGNYRAYGPEHLNRLSFIRRSRDLGFSIDQVRALLDLADERDRPCETIDAIAKAHLAEVDRKIADLRALRRELGRMIAQCGCGTVADCRIIEALSPPQTAAEHEGRLRSVNPGRYRDLEPAGSL